MTSNIEKYKSDLDNLIERGDMLHNAIQFECYPNEMLKELSKIFKDEKKAKIAIKKFPNFKLSYQVWYSEAQALIKQIIPDRLKDFNEYYEVPKNRKSLNHGTYVISDYLRGLVTNYNDVQTSSAIQPFQQQVNILKSAQKRFESSLFDIRQLVHADVLDSELQAARELHKSKYYRAAGMVAGVVLEKHLKEVCAGNSLPSRKAKPTISDFNDLLKNNNIIDTPQWRFIQHLADIRNVCGHSKGDDPTPEQVKDIIDGVAKISKTVF